MFKFIKAFIFDWRFKRACKKAEKYYKETRRHALVLMLGGKPIVKYRKVLKDEIRRKLWSCDIGTIEKYALYKTY